MVETIPRTSVTLFFDNVDQADYLEELLWVIPGVDSITQRFDGRDRFLGFQVIGPSQTLESDIRNLLLQIEMMDEVQVGAAVLITEEDWAESWKQYWKVTRLLPNLIIQPSWELFSPEPEDIVLQLDPGSAFGTGTHETTQLMLYLLCETLDYQDVNMDSLLDVGTGSGILAIYAAKRGVSRCVAIDNDPVAVKVAKENVALNHVSNHILCSSASIDDMLPDDFALVLANILATVIQEMLNALVATMQRDGLLMLSGIMRTQLPEMLTAISYQPLVLRRVLQKGDWVALVCQKTA